MAQAVKHSETLELLRLYFCDHSSKFDLEFHGKWMNPSSLASRGLLNIFVSETGCPYWNSSYGLLDLEGNCSEGMWREHILAHKVSTAANSRYATKISLLHLALESFVLLGQKEVARQQATCKSLIDRFQISTSSSRWMSVVYFFKFSTLVRMMIPNDFSIFQCGSTTKQP